MSFGEKIQNIRKENNLTQEELGEKLYVTRAAVSKWERNLCLPGEDIIEKISEEFHISVDDLLEKKDILRDANRLKKNTKMIIIGSVVGGTILLAISILLLVLLLTSGDYDEYYALVTNVDETYVYAETKNGDIAIPKNKLTLMENDEEEDTSVLLYNDYGLVTKKKNNFTLEITDHAETGMIVPSEACGIVLSFDEISTVYSNNPYYPIYYTDYYHDSRLKYEYLGTVNSFGSYFFLLGTFSDQHKGKLDEEETWNFSYSPEVLKDKEYCYIYYIENLQYEDGLHLKLFTKCYIKSNDTTITFTRTNPFVSDSLYEAVSHVKISFTAKDKSDVLLHQYDENMNLLNTKELTGNYIGEEGFYDSVMDTYYNFLSVDGKIRVLGSKEVKNDSSYTDFIPYETGFYKWSL